MIKYYDFSYDSKFWEYHIVSNLVIKNTPFPNGKVLALAAGFESVSTALYLCGFNVLHTDIDLKKCNLVEMYGKISTNVNVLQEDMVTLTNVGNGYDTVYHISSFEHLNQEQRIICLDNSIRISTVISTQRLEKSLSFFKTSMCSSSNINIYLSSLLISKNTPKDVSHIPHS